MSTAAIDDQEEEEPTVEGPAAPDFIDRVNDEPLPPGASNGQMGDEQWPPAVPSQAPGMVAKPPQLNAPPVVPGAAPSTIPQQMAQAAADQQDIANADVEAQQNLGTAKAAASGAEADQLDTEADRRQEAADQQAQIIQTANQRTQQWADRAAAENEKYMKMDLHDYWADKSTGQKVLGGLAMILGAVGRTDNSGNAGMQIINQAIERDFRMQQARIEKQKNNAAAAREQYQTGLTEKEQALSDAKMKEAAATDAAAAKLAALKVRQGIPVEQAQNDADVVALRQKANQLRMGTLKEVHGMNLEDAKLEIEKQKELDEKLRAEAYARKMAGKGAGGGVASGKAYDAFRAGVLSGAPNVGELAARAGLKPAQIAEQIDKIKKEEAAGGAGGKDVKEISAQFDKDEARLLGTGRTPGIIARQRELRELGNNLRQAQASGDTQAMPAGAIAAKEMISRLNTGAARSAEQMHLFNSLTGTPQEKEAQLKKLFGNPSVANQTMVGLTKLAGQSDEEMLQQIDKARGSLVKSYLGPNGQAKTPGQREHANARLTKMFGETYSRGPEGETPRYQEGGAASPAGPAKAAPVASRMTAKTDRDKALIIKARKAVNDPKTDPDVKASAQELLDRFGEK